MTTFDRHLFRRLLSLYGLFVAALIVFFVVLHYVEYVDDFMDRGAQMRDVFRVYYPSYIPEIVRLTSPLALFLSCVYLTSRLAQELQFVALQAGGVSLYRLLVPYVLAALLVTAGLFWLGGYIVPRTQATVLAYDQRYLKDQDGPAEVSDIHRQNAPGSYLAVGYFDREEATAYRVSLLRYEGQTLRERVDAQRMLWQESEGRWRFESADYRHFGPDGEETLRAYPTLDTLLNVLPRDLARTQRDVEAMTIPEAQAYLRATERSGVGNLGQPLVAYYSKFSYPLAHLILVLIAVPLASVRRRGGQAVQFILGLAVAFLYLATQKLTEPFGYTGTLAPEVAAWLPHAPFLLFALVLLVTARK